MLTKPNGATHDGDWVNGIPHGYGVARYVNGDVYKGYFDHGKRQGPDGEYTC